MSGSKELGAAEIRALAITALEDLKALNIIALDVSEMTTVMEHMIIASGSSRRHVKALADNVVEAARDQGLRPLGMEGEETTGWILVDFGDVVVHLMSEEMRDFYELEKLWTVS